MKNLSLGLILLLLVPVMQANAAGQTDALIDYGDPKSNSLWRSFQGLEAGNTQPLRILQLGDSHTAGDYFSGRLREQLQHKFGNAGIGWLTPGKISNQRSQQVFMLNSGDWKLSDSKQITHTGIFPLGGLINSSRGNSAVEIKVKTEGLPVGGKWRMSVWQQTDAPLWNLLLSDGSAYTPPSMGDSNLAWHLSWQELDAAQIHNLRLHAPQGMNLGGIILDRLAPGITLDALGINGATSAAITRWDQASLQAQLQWRNPQLIILAYGTNEAFDTDLVPDIYEEELRQTIRRLRTAAPYAAILLLGAPSSAKTRAPNINGGCRIPLPPSLIKVQNSQRRIARQERTLYWDWAAMMGGNCAAQSWIKHSPPLMRPDLVHLTAEGYAASADALLAALLNAIPAAAQR